MSTIKVDGIRSNSASSDAITLANDGTCTANVTNNLSNRNKIINGSMLVAQRGTTFSAGASELFTLDRFKTEIGSAFNFDTTITQETDSPNGFQKSLKITPDSTQTVNASKNAGIFTHLEGQDLQDFASGTSGAKKVVFSFYAKSASSNNNHQYSIFIRFRNGSNYAKLAKSFTVTTSWQRFSVAFDFDTSTNQIGTASSDICTAGVFLVTGPDDLVSDMTSLSNTTSSSFQGVTGQDNFMDNTSNEFYITGMQLEVSPSGLPTDFEHKSYDQELTLCQRYCQIYVNPRLRGVLSGSAEFQRMGFTLLKKMRAAPSATWSGSQNVYSGSGTATITGMNAVYTNDDSFEIDSATSGTLGTGQGSAVCAYIHTSAATLTLTSELA